MVLQVEYKWIQKVGWEVLVNQVINDKEDINFKIYDDIKLF